MDIFTMIGGYIASDLRMATPILLAGLGLLVMNRSGLLNIGCEGVMLLGTLAAVVGSYLTGSVWLGFLAALVVGGLMGALFALLTVSLRANQIVVGVAINILGSGLSATLYRAIFGVNTSVINIDTFKQASIPVLSKLPLFGNAFFTHMPIVYLALAAVPVVSYILFKTQTGLNLRAVGENPKASDTLGINVYRVRFLSAIIGCMLIAGGGAFLSTGLLRFFSEDMTSGRGFIALAAVIFGRYKPAGVLIAALLFAAGNVVANTMQAAGTNIPYNFLVMIPYVLTVVALAGFAGKTVAPAATAKPYIRG